MSREAQRKEEWLQEERLEREKLEVELSREKDCNRVSTFQDLSESLPSQTTTPLNIAAHVVLV